MHYILNLQYLIINLQSIIIKIKVIIYTLCLYKMNMTSVPTENNNINSNIITSNLNNSIDDNSDIKINILSSLAMFNPYIQKRFYHKIKIQLKWIL